MKIKNFEEVIKRLLPYLNRYLEDNGIDVTRNFTCLNPAHDDKHPSCNTNGNNNETFYCYSCQASGNIFKAAHYLEGKPLVGKEFIVENLLYLANKYGIEVDNTELTEDEIYELDTYRAYRCATDIITNVSQDSKFDEVIKARQWSRELCKEYGVGYVASYKEFRDQLKQLGFGAQFLDDIDLNRKEIFDANKLIFTIKDEYGRPVGFASRNLAYTEDKTNGAKYVNQKTTGVKCNIYKKGSRLFGFDQLLKKHPKKSDPVYIFEGYADVVTARKFGLTNCVAVGGLAFTDDQLQLLKDYGYYNIYICLDGDLAGQNRVKDILDKNFGGHKDVKVSVVIIPDNLDPDDFLKERGVEEFKQLRIYSAFEWRLLQFNEDTDADIICKSMIPLIVNESSHVVQEQMVNILAEKTGISIKALQGDVTRLQNTQEAERSRERQNILDKMNRNIQRSPTEAEYFMNEAQAMLYELSKRFNEDAFSEDSCIAFLDSQKVYQEQKSGEYMGYILGPDLISFQEAFCGEWKKDVWFAIGAGPNVGKSALMSKIAYEIAAHEENNAIVIYHTIDDSADQILPRFISVAEGSRKLTLNQVQDPKFHAKGIYAQWIFSRRENGYNKIRSLMKSGNLVLKDSNNGSSILYADRLIQFYKNKYPGRNIVYILDNFHKLQDYLGQDERVRFKALSTQIKAMATKHHICIISSVEYTKLPTGTKPTNNNIAESVQISYDANALIHLYNDYHELNEKATHYHIHPVTDDEEPKMMPRVELIVGKNKISGFKGRFWLDFFPDCSDWAYVDSSIPNEDEKTKQENKGNQNRFTSILDSINENN